MKKKYFCVKDVKDRKMVRGDTNHSEGILTVNLNTNDIVQDLNYTYDAVGNITTVRDDSQQTVFFANAMIQPVQKFTYDGLNRLIVAEGREKIGLATMGLEDDWDNAALMGETMPAANGQALQNYTQTYTYDLAGNMLKLQHSAPQGSYTRDYTIDTASNRLLQTEVMGQTYQYQYDIRGNMTTMPHLQQMHYNLQNAFSYLQRGTDEAYYQYRGGERSRKIVQKQGGITEERIYLGSFEIFRIFVGQSLDLERKTVHIQDDMGKIAMFEYRTQGNDNSPQELLRYIYSNNLQSSNLELNENGEIISYEEYHPFGTTSYQATNAQINAVAKRYRYTGKERDEESGLYYHGARYYIPWLCRWSQCDPIGIKDGLNVYAYCSNNPVMMSDPSGMGGEEEQNSQSNIQLNDPKIDFELLSTNVKSDFDKWKANKTVANKQLFIDSMNLLINSVSNEKTKEISQSVDTIAMYYYLTFTGVFEDTNENFNTYFKGCIGITMAATGFNTDTGIQTLMKNAIYKNLEDIPDKDKSHVYAINLRDSKLWRQDENVKSIYNELKDINKDIPKLERDKIALDAVKANRKLTSVETGYLFMQQFESENDDFKENENSIDISDWDLINPAGTNFDFGYLIKENVFLHADRGGPSMIAKISNSLFFSRPVYSNPNNREDMGCSPKNPCIEFPDFNRQVFGKILK